MQAALGAATMAPGEAQTRSALDFASVFREHRAYAWRVLRYLGVAEGDLEDAAQEVFLVVHRRLPEFRGDSSVRTWIYGICLRVAAAQRRRSAARREDPIEEAAGVGVAGPGDRVRARRTLQRLLDVLDEDKRAVWVLHEIGELTMSEVAAAVECPLQTAYSRHHAARRLLEEAAARVAEEEEGR